MCPWNLFKRALGLLWCAHPKLRSSDIFKFNPYGFSWNTYLALTSFICIPDVFLRVPLLSQPSASPSSESTMNSWSTWESPALCLHWRVCLLLIVLSPWRNPWHTWTIWSKNLFMYEEALCCTVLLREKTMKLPRTQQLKWETKKCNN